MLSSAAETLFAQSIPRQSRGLLGRQLVYTSLLEKNNRCNRDFAEGRWCATDAGPEQAISKRRRSVKTAAGVFRKTWRAVDRVIDEVLVNSIRRGPVASATMAMETSATGRSLQHRLKAMRHAHRRQDLLCSRLAHRDTRPADGRGAVILQIARAHIEGRAF